MDIVSVDIGDFDLFESRAFPESARLHQQFRERCPVGRSEQNGGFWYVTSYDANHAIARDPATFSSRQGNIVPPIGLEPLVPLDYDPPEHSKYRAPLQNWFAAASMARFEDRLRDMARRYVSQLTSPCDAVADFTLPYALEVVTAVVGVPAVMRETMVTTMRTLLGEAGVDPANAGELMSQFGQFIQAMLIDPRRAQGPSDDPDDIVDLLVGAEVDGRPFTDREIRQAVLALLNAGFETTYKTLAAMLWLLAQHPAAWEGLRSGAVPFEPAFEEMLRLSAPVSVGRLATRDVTIDGQCISSGDWVLLCLPAANRDEREFPDAESLTLSRQPNRHLTFGTGVHRCIGMHLARLELTIALREAFRAFERIWLSDDAPPTFSGSQAAGLVGLPLSFVRTRGS